MKNLYSIKKCADLLPGDIVLHPVFRSDGLLFIKKYKNLSGSVILHLRKQFPAHYPFLVAMSHEDLIEMIDKKVLNSAEFLEEMTNIIEVHQQFIVSPLSIQLYAEDISLSNN
jgi:hypothetical protein